MITSCTSNSARRSSRWRAARRAATAASTCRAATKCRCSTRSDWKARTTSAAASTRSPSRSSTCAFRRSLWQTYDIDFTAARYENGKKVKNARITVDAQRRDGAGRRRTAQGHAGSASAKVPIPPRCSCKGTAIRSIFRNIWVVEKK